MRQHVARFITMHRLGFNFKIQKIWLSRLDRIIAAPFRLEAKLMQQVFEQEHSFDPIS